MPEPAVQAFVRRLARGASGAASPGDPDPELLRRFAADRDEGAFAALVERHGPMVLDVCRAVLGNHADAEDAFQATFLLLARNAGGIRRPGSLAAWLHGVAYRTARKARARTARRRECEARAPARPYADPDDLSWAEVRRAVHEALAALGERYRAPLVMCCLGGVAQERAAEALGLTHAALKKRLERGREMLRAALTRRGFGPAALLAVAVAPVVPVPPALAESTAQAAALFAADPASAALPAHVTRLAHGGNSMTPVKLLCALVLFPAVAAGLVLAGNPAPPEARADNPHPPAAPAPVRGEPEAPGDREAKELAGEWRVAFVEASGKSAFPGDELKDARITIKGGAAVVEGFELLFVKDFTFKLDAAKQPKEIDVTFTEGPMKGKTFEGIYVPLKDEVRVCLRLKNTNFGRPKGFSTVSGAGLYTFFLRPADGKAPPAPPRLAPAATAERDPQDVFKKACEALAALEKKHELLKGVSEVTPVVERDEQKRFRSAELIFHHNAVPRGKLAARAKDDSKPFIYVWVTIWPGRSQQPPPDIQEFQWKGETFQMWVRVYGSDDKLVKAVRDAVAAPPANPAPGGAQAPAKTGKVTGTLASSEYAKAGGRIERAIVSVLSDPDRKQLAHSNTKHLAPPVGPDFAFDLPPGKYILECTAVGSRGATFVPTYKKFTLAEKAALDLGEIDLPASKVTKLFGKPAPELDGIVAWKNTVPLKMKGLKGKVVVLDFWSYSCSICLHHKPDLAKLMEKYKDKPLVVLTVHDGSAETMEDVDKKVPEVTKKKAGHLPTALDRAGDKGVFGAYGITAVPMVILIDAEGKVVRRFHHAGDPELDREVGRLLGASK